VNSAIKSCKFVSLCKIVERLNYGIAFAPLQ
jgi:hypothetical protein